MLQFQCKIRGDWASSCIKSIKTLQLNMNLKQIKMIKLSSFKNVLQERIKSVALKYLLDKQKQKGRDIEYKTIKMSDYLLPNNIIRSIKDQQLLFSLRNKMLMLNDSYNVKTICKCGQIEDYSHIYNCKILNINEPKLSYQKIYNGNLIELSYILERMKENLKKREDN